MVAVVVVVFVISTLISKIFQDFLSGEKVLHMIRVIYLLICLDAFNPLPLIIVQEKLCWLAVFRQGWRKLYWWNFE